MALPLPKGHQIHIIYRNLKNNKGMAAMEAAPDH